MILHPPFVITARLLPGLRIGNAWLSLEGIKHGERDRATFVLDFPGGKSYTDRQLQSGVGGFRSSVEVFETFLSFLSACAESMRSRPRGENADLFPRHIGEWACENEDEISMLQYEMQVDDAGHINHDLIEE